MGAFVGIGFLLLIMVVFIIGIVIFLAGVISLIIYIAVKRKKKKRIRPIIALPIVAVDWLDVIIACACCCRF